MLKSVFQPLHPLRLPPPDSFHNQTVLITGANTGVGLEAARHALSLGASKIIMGVRSVEKGARAREDILSTVPTATQASLEVWHLDLASFQNVMAFVRRMREYVKQPGNRLDTAIMNAGLASGEWNMSPDGWEMNVQVNGLSTALLSLELLPILIYSSSHGASDPKQQRPHLVIVSSDMHQMVLVPQRNAPNILVALNDKKQWEQLQAKNMAERYGASKLFSQWINIELAKLVPVDPQTGLEKVIVTSATPGFTKSELLTRENPPFILTLIQSLFGRTSAHGAMAIVDAAARQDGHGKWLENLKLTELVPSRSVKFNLSLRHTDGFFSPGYIVSSPEGQKVREQAWREILDVLKRVDPDLKLSYS
jgi:retinol dehydrogenase 12